MARKLILLAAITASLFVVGSATAATTIYWGYNFQTKFNPAAGEKCVHVYQTGYACSGYNNWDRSQVGYDNGSAGILFGFKNSPGGAFGGVEAYFAGTWTIIRTEWNQYNDPDINPYNFGICAWWDFDGNPNTFAYDQCRMIIF